MCVYIYITHSLTRSLTLITPLFRGVKTPIQMGEHPFWGEHQIQRCKHPSEG
jgi:hypothetical protein